MPVKTWAPWILFSGLLVFSFQNCAPQESANPDAVEKNCSQEPCDDTGTAGTKSCSFNGAELQDGEAVDAYLESAGARCQVERRVCDEGNLSGSYQFPSCSESSGAKKSCLFDGKAIAHGASVRAYLSSSVATGQSCSSQQRTCDDGVLSGSYTYPSCRVEAPSACTFDGRTIAHGASVRAFLHSSSPANQKLCDVSQTRACNDGTLSGSYSFSSCTVNQPRACVFDGRTVPHGGSVRAYRNSTSRYGESSCTIFQNRVCNDGVLSGSYEHGGCTVGAPEACLFNGKTVPHGGSAQAYYYSSAPFGSTRCDLKETRRCTNGFLSGIYEYASCQVAAPRSCLFNGRTIAHGGTVVGYTSSTGLKGSAGACAPVTRTCRDGTLDNATAQYASCTVSEPKSCLFKGKTVLHGGKVYAYTKASNEGVGKCNLQTRVCNDGTLSGTATFESCIHKCRYGKFDLDDTQIILYRMDGARRECSDNPVAEKCRIAQPALQIGSFVGDKTVWGGYLAGLSCSPNGNGKVSSYRLLVKNSAAGMCGNPMMSTPIKLNTLTSPYGGRYSRVSALITVDVNRSNSNLIWHTPYRLKGPLPK